MMLRGKIRLCSLVLGTLSCLAAGAQVQELYLKGTARLNREQYTEARDLLEKAVEINGNNTDYLLRLADACYHSGDMAPAMDYLKRVETISPGKGCYMLARIHASMGNIVEAVGYLERHLRSPYRLPSREILLDEAYFGIEDTREWKDLWSRNWYTADEVLLQEIRYQVGDNNFLQALEEIDKVLVNRGDWDALHAERGNVLREMGQFQGSVQSYSIAIGINPGEPGYYYGRAKTYIAQGKPDKAIPDLERACRKEPEKMDLLMELGKLYNLEGRFSSAAEMYRRYLVYYPDETEAMYLMGQAHFDNKQYLDALDQFNKCLRLETGDARFFEARGRTYLETGTYMYAVKDFSMSLDLDPGNPEVWYLKGRARWYLNDPEGAMSDWERAARLGSFDAAREMQERRSR